MLANNRFFGITAATQVSGLAPSPNALPFFQILARQSGGYGKTVSAPRGYGAGGLSWPARAGELSSDVDATIKLSASGALVLGRFIDGEASITLGASGSVEAVAAVAGTAAIALTASATLQGQASASGSASITLGAAANLTATAALAGQANITLGAAGTLGATAEITGIAYLSAAAEGGQLTTAGIATAVWSAQSADNNDAGTMGQKLNSAASGGVDYTALAEAVATHVVEGGITLEEALRIMLAPLAGKATGIGTGTEVYMKQDGVTPRLTVGFDVAGNRTSVGVDPS